MEVAYLYTKPRHEFGKQVKFTDTEARIIDSIPSSDEFDKNYVKRQPSITNLATTADYSEHEVNTERLVTKSSSMRHVEGGWPKDVDPTEQSDVNRFRKKAEKDDDYKLSVKSLGPIIDRCMKQNNTIDIYDDYFEGDMIDLEVEPPSAKGLAVFRDPNQIKRTVTSIDWHPENPNKIAASYCILTFQDPRFTNHSMPRASYIWDVMNPNTPDKMLKPASPLVCMRFNPKSTDSIVGGSYNGLVSFFDLRKGNSPVETSIIEKSHHDPVYDIFWISSKTGNQCVSVSTDGQMLWWDTRRLGEPTDSLTLEAEGQVLGGSSLEYNTEAGPTKYLVGTEQGVVMSINLRNRKQNNGITVYDNGPGKHHGPIYSIQRNPTHNKFFLTVGDWTARVWTEDIKSPIMSTTYHESYLTAGCWSPTRAGVFFVTRMDGVVDIWDYYYRQNEVAYSHKVSDAGLSSISVQGNSAGGGRLLAVGDENGMVSLLEVSEGLATQQSNEKAAIASMLERETKREKNLEIRERDLRRKRAAFEAQQDEAGGTTDKDDKMEELLRKVDADFLVMIKDAEDKDSASVSGVNDQRNVGE